MRIWTACGCICPNVALVLGIEEENGPQLTSLAGHFYGHKTAISALQTILQEDFKAGDLRH
uniref:Uncharacterized protein n=1 Tax=Manihot esculenta TaxID=3983 RepID=A0A2C9UAC3_MANES